MKGSVRKRGNTWSYYFDLGTVNGKRQKKEKGGFHTKKEAEAALAKAITEYNRAGQIFEPSEITVSDYLDQWYDLYCKPNLKYNFFFRSILMMHIIAAIIIAIIITCVRNANILYSSISFSRTQ